MMALKDMHRFMTVNFYKKKCVDCGVIWNTEVTGVPIYIDDKKNRFIERPKCSKK